MSSTTTASTQATRRSARRRKSSAKTTDDLPSSKSSRGSQKRSSRRSQTTDDFVPYSVASIPERTVTSDGKVTLELGNYIITYDPEIAERLYDYGVSNGSDDKQRGWLRADPTAKTSSLGLLDRARVPKTKAEYDSIIDEIQSRLPRGSYLTVQGHTRHGIGRHNAHMPYDRDPRLTSKGKGYAEAIGDHYRENDSEFINDSDIYFTSNLTRTIETMEGIYGKQDFIINPGIAEFYRGKQALPRPQTELMTEFSNSSALDSMEETTGYYDPKEDFESDADFDRRIMKGLVDGLDVAGEEKPRQTWVSHHGVISHLSEILTGHEMHLANGATWAVPLIVTRKTGSESTEVATASVPEHIQKKRMEAEAEELAEASTPSLAADSILSTGSPTRSSAGSRLSSDTTTCSE